VGTSEGRFKILIRTCVSAIMPTVLICFAFLEIGLRATGRAPSNTTDGFYVQYNKSYRMKKNFSKRVHTPSYTCTIYTNSLGFRVRIRGEKIIGRTPYFVFLGESLTFGNGVDYDQSFVGVFDQLVKEHGFEAVNLAVGGHGFNEQEEIFKDFLAAVPQMPAHVIICFSPPFVRRIVNYYPDLVVKGGYAFTQQGWILPYLRVLLGDSSAVYCFFRDNIRKIQSRSSSVDSDQMLQILANYSKDNKIKQPSNINKIEERLKALDTLIIKAGATPIYVYLPPSTDFDANEFLISSGKPKEKYDLMLYCNLLAEHCKKSEIKLINLFPILQEHYDQGEKLNFMMDGHYNPMANKVIGETIFRSVFNNGNPSYSAK